MANTWIMWKILLSDSGEQIFWFFFGQSVIFPTTIDRIKYNIFHLQISKHQAYNFLCDRNKYDNNLGKNMDSKGYKYGSQN